MEEVGAKITIRNLHECFTLVGYHTDPFIVGRDTLSLKELATLKNDVTLFGKTGELDGVPRHCDLVCKSPI